jgi:hypothetical protein
MKTSRWHEQFKLCAKRITARNDWLCGADAAGAKRAATYASSQESNFVQRNKLRQMPVC